MKVVILAAGAGKRFRRLDLPKSLTRLVNGKSILGLQLDTLSRFISLDNVIVVVGYHKQKIMDQFPDLLYVYNPSFADENTAKSLLRALQKVHNEDLLWLNADVVFHPDALRAVLACKKNCMLVNEASVDDEEVKYRTNKQGEILEVSKEVKNPQGEALGINFFTQKNVDLLKNKLALCDRTDYFERAIEMCIQEGASVWSVPVASELCTEIDFPEDLDRANAMIQNWRL